MNYVVTYHDNDDKTKFFTIFVPEGEDEYQIAEGMLRSLKQIEAADWGSYILAVYEPL